MLKTYEPQGYDYGNKYEVWCYSCNGRVEVKDPKTLKLPKLCPSCKVGVVEVVSNVKYEEAIFIKRGNKCQFNSR